METWLTSTNCSKVGVDVKWCERIVAYFAHNRRKSETDNNFNIHMKRSLLFTSMIYLFSRHLLDCLDDIGGAETLGVDLLV